MVVRLTGVKLSERRAQRRAEALATLWRYRSAVASEWAPAFGLAVKDILTDRLKLSGHWYV